jgi:hypothetical protein
MRIGKTEKQIIELKEQLDSNQTILVAGLKEPSNYLERLGKGYIAEESFVTRQQTRTYDEISGAIYWTDGEKIKTGYIFKKL